MPILWLCTRLQFPFWAFREIHLAYTSLHNPCTVWRMTTVWALAEWQTFVLWDYVFNLIICALKGYVSFTFLNDTSSHFRIMCDSAGLLDLLSRFGAQVKIHWRYISTPCIYCSRTYTGYRLVVCVRHMFHLLFSALTTKLILAASFGVDSSAMRPCQTNAYSLGTAEGPIHQTAQIGP